jgi:hypothetical protein
MHRSQGRVLSLAARLSPYSPPRIRQRMLTNADVCPTHVSVDVSMPFASHMRHEEDCKKRGEGRETEETRA